MLPRTSAHEIDDPELVPSPFRAAIGRARIEALADSGPPLESHRADAVPEQQQYEYRLVKRRGKRAAEEAAWNALGREGWELVGMTGRHAAFKRRVPGGKEPLSR